MKLMIVDDSNIIRSRISKFGRPKLPLIVLVQR
jgi:hypothetical protein